MTNDKSLSITYVSTIAVQLLYQTWSLVCSTLRTPWPNAELCVLVSFPPNGKKWIFLALYAFGMSWEWGCWGWNVTVYVRQWRSVIFSPFIFLEVVIFTHHSVCCSNSCMNQYLSSYTYSIGCVQVQCTMQRCTTAHSNTVDCSICT